MKPSDMTQHSASDSLQGYFYQCRLALLETLIRLRDTPNITVFIETLDDVVFAQDKIATEVIQVKHHQSCKKNLSDYSPDLWKSMRIWIDLYKKNVSHKGAVFCLMTTESVADDSAVMYLRTEHRDPQIAKEKLLHIAQNSTNKKNESAYEAFRDLADEDRHSLLESVYILDECPLNSNLDNNLEKELYLSCQRTQIGHFRQYLESWWYQEILKCLNSAEAKPIRGVELETYLNRLREQFQSDSLPIDPDLKNTQPDFALFKNQIFTKQLQLIGINSPSRLTRTAKNFYMASEQRSRWVREELLINNELEEYDHKLIEEWEIRFDQEQDNNDFSHENERISSGKRVFEWVERDAQIEIRRSCTESFITRGSYQILANHLKVGWHPDFKDKLNNETEETTC